MSPSSRRRYMSYTHSKRSHKRRPNARSTRRAGGSRPSNNDDAVKPRPEDLRVHTTKGSVFFDICDTPEEAQNLTLRSELMMQIEQIIRRRRLTQNRAAKLFGVTQPRISDLVRGKIDLFSLDS